MHIYMGVSMMLRISNKFDLFDRYYRDCVIVIYERRESDCNLKKKKKNHFPSNEIDRETSKYFRSRIGNKNRISENLVLFRA